ncbi:MAG: hypothetical protein MUC87_01545 [Bacteroidia bacterium]|jgi:hypothetical protein|nr:hypothetical protein [Bacteroidia bacterium]
MAKQTNTTKTSRLVALLAGAMVTCNQLFAAGSDNISAGEILMYIALIVGVILAAWFLSNGKSSGSSNNQTHNTTNRPHFDHPNDPHFRRLRKKTS